MMPDSAIHEALDALNDVRWRKTAFADLQWYYAEGGVYIIRCKHGKPDASLCAIRARSADEAVARAVAALPHTGKWKNGREYEYEYAYCSECGHMQWADWESHKQAEECIGGFADVYRFCPHCGAKMEGGVYVK